MLMAREALERDIVGAIDKISNNTLSGWIAYKDGSAYESRLHLLCAGSRFALPALRSYDRPDQLWAGGAPMKVGFSIELPPVFSLEELQGAIIETERGQQLEVWEGCRAEHAVPPKTLDEHRWEQLIDPYFLRNYMSMPIADPVSFMIHVLNDTEHRTFDPLYMVDHGSSRAFVRAITESTPTELHLPLNPHISAILRFASQTHLASFDTRVLLSVFRSALVTNVFNLPFAYQDYLERCAPEERRRIEEHHDSTGFDRLYCALVHHFHTAHGRKLMDEFNRFPTSVLGGAEPDMAATASAVEQAESFRPNAFKQYDFGLEHYIAHGQFEPQRLTTLALSPSLEVMAQVTKLRRLDPEIPDPGGLRVAHWGVDRSKKVLSGATKIWRAQEEGRVVLPIFMPWFTYGGADKESLLLGQAIRDVFADHVEVIFVLSAAGHHEDQLYKNHFNTVLLRPDDFTDRFHIDLAIQRIIAAPSVKCVINSNSLDFWQFFVKNPRMVSSLSAVATMTFCDDLNPETGGRDGWLRRFFKYVALQNSVLLSDNAMHVADFAADYHTSGLIDARVLHYPVIPNRRKRTYEINQRPRLLWASRLDEQKGIGTLATVAQMMPACEFHVFGSHLLSEPGHSVELLRSLNNVYMQGAYKDFDELEIEGFDLFLYTSAWDGLPNILLEIGAAGLPIVSSMVGGIPELLNAESAFLVADHSSACAYTERIREALACESARSGHAETLYDIISDKHSWPQFRRAVQEIFAEYMT